MPDFHSDEWSKMFGTSTCNSKPDNESEEPFQQPVQSITREIKDDSADEEETPRQRMSAPNPLTQPNQSTTPPTRTCSQVTGQQSESPSRELTISPRASPQSITNVTPTRTTENDHQAETTAGPPSSLKKKLRWGDGSAQLKSPPPPDNGPGS